MVFAPKYRGKMLVGDVAMICEGIICKICVEMDIQVVEKYIREQEVNEYNREK
jgi:putative transposase